MIFHILLGKELKFFCLNDNKIFIVERNEISYFNLFQLILKAKHQLSIWLFTFSLAG